MASYNNFIPEYKGNTTNRRIMYGPSNELWPVPQGTTEVEVHVWGGGGGSCTSPTPLPRGYGGGGGGYARARYSVTSTDCLCIVVGGNGGTSTVTIPTQAPTSPVSATGGTSGSGTPGNNPGGSGTVSLGPTHPTCYCFTADGGNGFGGPFTSPVVSSSGGAAGSPKGVGGFGTTGGGGFVGGGGIGGGYGTIGYGGPGKGQKHNTPVNGLNYCNFCGNPAFRLISGGAELNLQVEINNCGNDWFYVEDISGDGGMNICQPISPSPTVTAQIMTHGTAGGGGSGFCSRAGFLGGGGGATCCVPSNIPGVNASGGCAGGSAAIDVGPPATPHFGGSFPGTPGVVIVYW
jgi:hypothetical protein